MDIPKLLSVDVVDGQWCITSEYVNGKTLAQLMKENPKKIDSYIDKMVDLHIFIQSKRNPLLIKLKDKITRQINELDCIDATKKYELLSRLNGMHEHSKLCHGDFSPENIIVTKSGKYVAIDWVHATQGNASADVARTATELKILKQRSYQTNADIQQAIEDAIKDVIYIMNVYATLYEITPEGEYEVNFEWDDSIMVDINEEINKYLLVYFKIYISY